MADISTISVNGTSYNIKDATARNRLVPTGGTTGQVLAKKSNTNNDVQWIDGGGSGVPNGGTTGQVLCKLSDDNQDVGWRGVGNLPVGNWYLPAGILESNVIAAYQFIGMPSESVALTNINENRSYALAKTDSSVTWNSANGIYIPGGTANKSIGLTNSDLSSMESSCYCIVMGFYHSGDWRFNNGYGFAPRVKLGKTAGSKKMLNLAYDGDGNTRTGPSAFINNSYGGRYGTAVTHGVIGANFTSNAVELYVDGAKISTTSVKETSAFNNEIVIGNDSHATAPNDAYITAVVILNTALTAAQHVELSNYITALGGV